MNLGELIADLMEAEKRIGHSVPVGLRHAKQQSNGEGGSTYRIPSIRPVIVRIESGNVYLDPEPL